MKFGQLIGYNFRNIFLKNYAENNSEWLVPDLFWFFKKASKQVVSTLDLIYFGRPLLGQTKTANAQFYRLLV